MALITVRIKPHCHHRLPEPHGGLGKEYGPGSVIKVTPEEVRDFPDKFELVPEKEIEPPPVVAEYVEPVATPAAFKLAEQKNVDLSEVEGTGQDGKITKVDVQRVLDG